MLFREPMVKIFRFEVLHKALLQLVAFHMQYFTLRMMITGSYSIFSHTNTSK